MHHLWSCHVHFFVIILPQYYLFDTIIRAEGFWTWHTKLLARPTIMALLCSTVFTQYSKRTAAGVIDIARRFSSGVPSNSLGRACLSCNDKRYVSPIQTPLMTFSMSQKYFSTTRTTFESLRVKHFKEEKLPVLLTEKKLKQMRESLKLLTPNGYKKFFKLFDGAAKRGLHNTVLCSEVLNSIFCPDKQIAFVRKFNVRLDPCCFWCCFWFCLWSISFSLSQPPTPPPLRTTAFRSNYYSRLDSSLVYCASVMWSYLDPIRFFLHSLHYSSRVRNMLVCCLCKLLVTSSVWFAPLLWLRIAYRVSGWTTVTCELRW